MPNIMNQAQQPRVAHKLILHAIWKKLLKYRHMFWTKTIELPDPPCLAPDNEPSDWTRDCADYIGATDASYACNKGSRNGRDVMRHMDSQ